MIAQNYFSHTTPEGVGPEQRIQATGFADTGWAESIEYNTQPTLASVGFPANYAALDTEYSLGDLIVDQGVPDLGHRVMLLDIGGDEHALRQVGIGLASQDTTDGSFIDRQTDTTIDMASTANTQPFLTGVVFSDVTGNGEYEPGDGLGGVTITVANVGSTTTLDAGGFSMQLAPGTYTVTASGGGLPTPLTRTVVIGNDNVRLNFDENPNGATFFSNAGTAANVTLGSFPAIQSGDTPSSYSGRIDWGNGTASYATLVPTTDGGFSVTGQAPPYEAAGTYAVRVLLTHLSDGRSIALNGTAVVSRSSGAENLTATGHAVYAPVGTPLSGVVATFVDASGNTDLDAYSAYITWGDGNSSQGTVSALPGGGFQVTGGDTYSSEGIYSLSVVLTSTDGSTAVAYSSAIVYPAGPTGSTAAPVVSLVAPDISSENADQQTPYTFSVVYQDTAMVSFASLAGSTVQIQPPTGSPITAQEVDTQVLGSTDSHGDGSTIVVTYEVAPPGGNWYAAPPGTYTVELGGSPVTDLSGNPAPQGPAGTFQASTQPTLEVSPAVGVDTHSNATISNSASLKLSGYGEGDSTLKVYNGTLLVGTTQTGADGSWSITYEAPQNGTYDFSAVAIDSMGNTGAPRAIAWSKLTPWRPRARSPLCPPQLPRRASPSVGPALTTQPAQGSISTMSTSPTTVVRSACSNPPPRRPLPISAGKPGTRMVSTAWPSTTPGTSRPHPAPPRRSSRSVITRTPRRLCRPS